MNARSYRRARRQLTTVLSSVVFRAHSLAHHHYDRREPGSLIRAAREVRLGAVQGVTASVLAERAAGLSWGQVAEALSVDESYAREHYGPIEAQWLTDGDGDNGGSLAIVDSLATG